MGEEKAVLSSGSEEETTPPPTHSARTCAFRWFDAGSSNLMEHHVMWENGAALNQSGEQKSFPFISKLDSLIFRNAQFMGGGGRPGLWQLGFAI